MSEPDHLSWDADTYHEVSDPQRGWADAVLARIPFRGDEVVLDAGCGSGDVTRALAERVPRGRVVAVDGSPEMLALTRRRLADLGYFAVPPGDSPRFDALDNINGASRLETKIDNVLYGRDKETGEVWQVGRLTLYQGNDFYNELSEAEDYEIEFDIRPRPWWGFQLVGERHVIDGELDIDDPFFVEQRVLELLDNTLGVRFDNDLDFNARFGDYNRLLTQFYYDRTPYGGRVSGRLGFAYTETQDRVFNREILYGLGLRLNDNWGIGFEHRYDFEDGEFRTQTYEVRRRLHEWEAAMRFRDRESGFDIDLAFSLVAFPGSKIKF